MSSRSGIWRVDTGKNGKNWHGTGFAIGPRHLFTALHVVLPSEEWGAKDAAYPPSVKINAVIETKDVSRNVRIAWPPIESVGDDSLDVAVLELADDQPPFESFIALDWSTPWPVGRRSEIVGFPGGGLPHDRSPISTALDVEADECRDSTAYVTVKDHRPTADKEHNALAKIQLAVRREGSLIEKFPGQRRTTDKTRSYYSGFSGCPVLYGSCAVGIVIEDENSVYAKLACIPIGVALAASGAAKFVPRKSPLRDWIAEQFDVEPSLEIDILKKLGLSAVSDIALALAEGVSVDRALHAIRQAHAIRLSRYEAEPKPTHRSSLRRAYFMVLTVASHRMPRRVSVVADSHRNHRRVGSSQDLNVGLVVNGEMNVRVHITRVGGTPKVLGAHDLTSRITKSSQVDEALNEIKMKHGIRPGAPLSALDETLKYAKDRGLESDLPYDYLQIDAATAKSLNLASILAVLDKDIPNLTVVETYDDHVPEENAVAGIVKEVCNRHAEVDPDLFGKLDTSIRKNHESS